MIIESVGLENLIGSIDRTLFTTFFEAECCSCGYKWVNKFNRYEYREIFDKVESEFPDELIHGRI